MKQILFTVLACLLLAGCATKHYGRQGVVTSFERDTMNCREIELETAKVQGFVEQVNKESRFSGKDVLAILGDFGIGNNMERSAALKSAGDRLDQLHQLRDAKKCGAGA